MYAYHYWKCYYKEGPVFQTAKIYSTEVDYYHFGTCEITDGAYFCGDHSCLTYKYVTTKNAPVLLRENPLDFSSNHQTVESRYVQTTGDKLNGEPNRMDTHAATYRSYPGYYLEPATLVSSNSAVTYKSTFTGHGLKSGTNAANHCRNQCDADSTCKMYVTDAVPDTVQEAECVLFYGPWWDDLVSTSSALVPSASGPSTALTSSTGPDKSEWTVYVKRANAHEQTWLAAPISTDKVSTQGGSLAGLY